MQINYAFIGFLIVAIVFAWYAASFYKLASKKLPSFLKEYAYAYFCLALAFFIWAIAAIIGTEKVLVYSVLAGDLMLLIGSVLLILVLAGKRSIIGLILGIVVSLVLIDIRAVMYAPAPILSHGIFIFNTQMAVGVVLGLLFLLVWLPANFKVAGIAASLIKWNKAKFVYKFIYSMSTLCAILFMAFKTPTFVVLSFVALGCCFVMLLASNNLIAKEIK